jgi:hypothetical protein
MEKSENKGFVISDDDLKIFEEWIKKPDSVKKILESHSENHRQVDSYAIYNIIIMGEIRLDGPIVKEKRKNKIFRKNREKEKKYFAFVVFEGNHSKQEFSNDYNRLKKFILIKEVKRVDIYTKHNILVERLRRVVYYKLP